MIHDCYADDLQIPPPPIERGCKGAHLKHGDTKNLLDLSMGTQTRSRAKSRR